MSKFRYFSRFERLEREENASILPRSPRAFQQSTEEIERYPAGPQSGSQQSERLSKARQWRAAADSTSAASLRQIERDLEKFTERDFADPSNRKAYRTLRNAQLALEASRQNVPRPYTRTKVFKGPIGNEWPVTGSGTAARYSVWTSVGGQPRLARKSKLLPCIERYARRSALFALGKAGKGWRTPHKRKSSSWINC